MTKEKVERHLSSLKVKHHELDKMIEALEAERAPDELVHKRKVEKLHLKDEIVKLENELSGS